MFLSHGLLYLLLHRFHSQKACQFFVSFFSIFKLPSILKAPFSNAVAIHKNNPVEMLYPLLSAYTMHLKCPAWYSVDFIQLRNVLNA